MGCADKIRYTSPIQGAAQNAPYEYRGQLIMAIGWKKKTIFDFSV